MLAFLISPTESYRFSQLIENHAVDTYSEFIEANEEALKNLPAPEVAHEYYENFIYYFYEFQMTGSSSGDSATPRSRPQINCLYDVFQNILEDEVRFSHALSWFYLSPTTCGADTLFFQLEHTRTMKACIDYIQNGDVIWYNGKCVSGRSRGHLTIPAEKRQKFWKDWAKLYDDQSEQ